ncbi:PTS mannose transporter subunit IID [Lactobacillus sp. CRM56-3]|uniref:PTS mannose transporter subunit IID n=2 Tax=Secundilactobacillus folii TaxID=2678357 RepID=A0A7X3C386_9LACO|nr:PTS system mannose/fructose/sorbose family transporter subunit IID [Secundilactobacillus folii]MTV82366.1 PTS mannose transporter subunit IID [Secundilactobacillus folii]
MEKTEEKQLTRSDLARMVWRSSFEQGSWNYQGMQNLGFAYIMVPAIKRLYDSPKQQQAALQRHLTFFNTMPYMQSTITGVVANVEQQRANGAPVTSEMINDVKTGMMGPLAGVGDPVWWGTLRPVLAALGAGLAIGDASLLGPLLFFFGWNIARLVFRAYTQKLGFQYGTEVADRTGHWLPKLTQGASILGMFVMGAVVPRWTTIKMPIVLAQVHVNNELKQITLQMICNRILPGLVPVILTLVCVWLLRKRIHPMWLIFGMFIIGILGYVSGVLAL